MPKRENIYTPSDKYPTYQKSGTRIRIPQPKQNPIQLFSKDAVKRELMGRQAVWFTLHHRGLKRPWIGVDPLEARAVSRNAVRGTLPERIVFKKAMTFGFVPGADFDFQSSQSGGRMELGGMVSDFLFENLKLVLQVEGPFHKMTLQSKRDEEQDQILADMGYDVVRLYEREIYNEALLDDKFRRIFGFARSSGRSFYTSDFPEITKEEDYSDLFHRAQYLNTLAKEMVDLWLH